MNAIISSSARLVAGTALLLFGAMAHAQSEFPITTDRPSFSDGPLIVPLGRINLEMGYTYFEAAGTRTHTLPEVIFRLPLNPRFELRLVNLTYGSTGDLQGLFDPQIGFKYKLADGLALVATTTVPMGSDDFRVDDTQPTVKLAWYTQATEADGFGGNLNVSFLGPERGFTQYAASLYWSRTLNAKMGTFLEFYRLMPAADGGPDANFVDAGVTYLLNPATQLDFRIGTGFDRGRDGAFVGVGVSYRF